MKTAKIYNSLRSMANGMANRNHIDMPLAYTLLSVDARPLNARCA